MKFIALMFLLSVISFLAGHFTEWQVNASSTFVYRLGREQGIKEGEQTALAAWKEEPIPIDPTLYSFGPEKRFVLGTLAYPQYESDYELSQAQWHALQDYCRNELHQSDLSEMAFGKGNRSAVDSVYNHWKSIVNGTPPFGLRVQSK